MLKLFANLVESGSFVAEPLKAARLKLHVSCPWSCSWCHQEGNFQAARVPWSEEVRRALEEFRAHFGFLEVHLTGGEPTVYPDLAKVVADLCQWGFRVKMTTNGDTPWGVYDSLLDAGLAEVNVSVHTLQGDKLAALMDPPRPAAWGERAIGRQLLTVAQLSARVTTKINTVVVDDVSAAVEVGQYCRVNGVSWRPMNELAGGQASLDALTELCRRLGARPIRAKVIQGSSSCGIDYDADGFRFTVKLIRPFTLDRLCDRCPTNAAGRCYEYYYGPRLEYEHSRLEVRSCLHRSGNLQTMPVRQFFDSALPAAIIEAMEKLL